jgi:hypothetical protein
MGRAAWCAALTAAVLGLALPGTARAQSADDIIERNLAAMGGRAALEKLQTRVVSGKVTVAVQGQELPGTVEIWLKAPNKSRSLTRIDLRGVGGGDMVVDQRCDGVTASISDSQRGDRDVGGAELAHLLNASFPTPFLRYKEAGARIDLAGPEKLAGQAVVVIVFTPKSGAPTRLFLDANTWLLVRAVTTIPANGAAVQQVSSPSDYRVVDGVRVPFVVSVETPGQGLTMRLDKVAHNVPIDDALFRRPRM